MERFRESKLKKKEDIVDHSKKQRQMQNKEEILT